MTGAENGRAAVSGDDNLAVRDEQKEIIGRVTSVAMDADVELLSEAADEIERLRAAGDALADNYAAQLLNEHWSAFNAAFLRQWEEARRG